MSKAKGVNSIQKCSRKSSLWRVDVTSWCWLCIYTFHYNSWAEQSLSNNRLVGHYYSRTWAFYVSAEAVALAPVWWFASRVLVGFFPWGTPDLLWDLRAPPVLFRTVTVALRCQIGVPLRPQDHSRAGGGWRGQGSLRHLPTQQHHISFSLTLCTDGRTKGLTAMENWSEKWCLCCTRLAWQRHARIAITFVDTSRAWFIFFPFYQDFSINNRNKWPWCKETHFLLIKQGFIANGRQLAWITPRLILESQMRLKFGLGTLSFFLSHLFIWLWCYLCTPL